MSQVTQLLERMHAGDAATRDARVRHQDARRLEVAVDHLVAVRILHRIEHLQEQL